MASTKEFLIKTVYDEQGMKQFESDCNTAKVAAKQLGTAFSDSAKVIDQSIGTSINATGQKVRTVTSILEQHGKTAKVTFTEVNGVVKTTGASFQSFSSFASHLGGELTKLISRAILVVPIWEALRFGLKSLEDTFIESIKFMIEWEDQMAHIRAVTGASKGDLDILSQGLLQLSATFGVSNKALAESANLWLRNGANISTVLPLVEATAKLSLLSGQSMEDAAKGLTAIMAGFKFNAADTALAVEKLATVEEKSGIALEVFTTAMSKTAATAHGLGISFDELTGFIAAIHDSTQQTGDLIGSELRSILLRLGTTAIDTAQAVSKVPFFLDELGNTTTQHTPKLRNLNSIITELALSFKNLSNAQQDQLAKAVGGNLRANAVTALFNNFDVAIKAQAESSFGLKDAGRAIADVTDTAKNHITQLQGAWGQFVETFQATGAIKGTLDFLKNSLEGLSGFLNPDKFNLNKALGDASKAQQESGKKFDQNVNLLKTIDQLHEMNDIFSKNIPGSIERSIVIAATFRKVFEDAGISIKGTFKDSFDLEKVLTGQKSDFLTKAVDASLQGKKDDIQKAFIENSKQLEDVLKSNETKFRVPVTEGQTSFIDDVLNKLTNLQKLTSGDVSFIKQHLLPGLSAEQGTAVSKLIDDVINKDQVLAAIDTERAATLDQISKKQKEQATFVATQEQVEDKLKDIQQRGTLIEEDKLVTIQKQLDVLATSNIEGNKTLQNEEDVLTLKKNKLLAERELLRVNLQQSEVLARMKADGASNLQLAVQELAFLKAQENPDADKVEKAKAKVRIDAIQEERSLQDALISAIVDRSKAEGDTQSHVLQMKIDLEDQLGIHLQGLDLLKQQLELYKAITEESKKTKSQRLDDLQNLIKKTPSPFSAFGQNNDIGQSFREGSLRLQASQKGIGQNDINKILNPPTPNGGQNGLISELQRGISDPLGSNISHLSEVIDTLSQTILEPQRIPQSVITPKFHNPEDGVVTVNQRRQSPSGAGASPNSGNQTTVDIGGIQVTVQGNTPEEISTQIGKITADLVANHLVKPGTKISKAFKQAAEEF